MYGNRAFQMGLEVLRGQVVDVEEGVYGDDEVGEKVVCDCVVKVRHGYTLIVVAREKNGQFE